MLYVPFGHTTPVDVVAAIGQYDPAAALHTPLHDAVDSPAVPPYVPTGHDVHATAPATSEY